MNGYVWNNDGDTAHRHPRRNNNLHPQLLTQSLHGTRISVRSFTRDSPGGAASANRGH